MTLLAHTKIEKLTPTIVCLFKFKQLSPGDLKHYHPSSWAVKKKDDDSLQNDGCDPRSTLTVGHFAEQITNRKDAKPSVFIPQQRIEVAKVGDVPLPDVYFTP